MKISCNISEGTVDIGESVVGQRESGRATSSAELAARPSLRFCNEP